MENTPEYITLIALFFSKAKLYIYAIVTAFLSGAIKYLQQIRAGMKPTFKQYIQFCIVASAITLTALSIIQYIGMQIDLFAYMIMFWAGISTEYFYVAIQKLLEKITDSYIKKQ